MPRGRKNCKACGAEIASVSKACPQCGMDCKAAAALFISQPKANKASTIDAPAVAKAIKTGILTAEEQGTLAMIISKKHGADVIGAAKAFRTLTGIACNAAGFLELITNDQKPDIEVELPKANPHQDPNDFTCAERNDFALFASKFSSGIISEQESRSFDELVRKYCYVGTTRLFCCRK